MGVHLPDGRINIHSFRAKLFGLINIRYRGAAPAPDILPALRSAGLVHCPSGMVTCQAEMTGKTFEGQPFSVQYLRAAGEGFSGAIVTLPSPVRLTGRVVVRPDLGPLNPPRIDGMKRVALVSSEFEAQFEAYADDQVEGRAVLPPDLIERLTLFENTKPGDIVSVAFLGRQAHIVVPNLGMGDRDFMHLTPAARHVAGEIAVMYSVLHDAELVLSKANRHDPSERQRLREDYYESAVLCIEPMVQAAIEAGVLTDSKHAKHLTEDYWLFDEALRGVLLPRF